jgi:hypothetical protein
MTSCTFAMSSDRSVRAEFRIDPDVTALPASMTVADIEAFLAANPSATTAAHLLRALPASYKQGWILMSRSESLQTGTAQFPRILLPSPQAGRIFTIGLAAHGSYPGTNPKAVEFMEWDQVEKTFRFHEIVLDDLPAVTQDTPSGPVQIVPARSRGVLADEPRCTRCHSTRNIPNPNPADRGTSVPNGTPPVKAKNKPNWDTLDSNGGAMPFNRDRIYQGSLEAAAFRKLLDPWSWRDNVPVRQVMEQLELQPPGVPAVDVITRVTGGAMDGRPVFSFDAGSPPGIEPAPVGDQPSVNVNYSFDGVDSSAAGSSVERGGEYVILHEVETPTLPEGRAAQLFDRLGGEDSWPNQQRVADEIASHRFATGGVPIDVRPVALAINSGCLVVNETLNRVEAAPGYPALNVNQVFFRDRHRITSSGMGINELVADTRARAEKLPLRKADIQAKNLDRAGDVYLIDPADEDVDLVQQYGAGTSQGASAAVERLRQEIFRRPIDAGAADATDEMEGHYVDREPHDANSVRMALWRFFLEPLGVSVDKWSMGVRGRSRTYTFGDSMNFYTIILDARLRASLEDPADGYPGLTSLTCNDLLPAVNSSLAALPVAVPPTYTDVQRVFNKGCIECHGGLGYPPFTRFYPVNAIDFSEEEAPASHDRLLRSHGVATALTSSSFDASNRIWTRITASGENCGDGVSVMPCGGPPLTGPDIDTIKRWIDGGRPNTHGDPHIYTVDGTHYDFQSAGEFTLLRGESLEIQARHTPVQTAAPLPADAHTGLSTCAAINTAAAIRVGSHRITYQPNLNGQPDPSGMQLRINGRLIEKPGPRGISLAGGGRIQSTPAPGGIQIEYPGGTDIVVTPNWWAHQQLWYLDIDVRHSRANFGVMGVIAPGNWLPALPNNSWLGPRPPALIDRHQQIHGLFADAWRVTHKSTLFDYASGTSTDTFTLKGWPAFQPGNCRLPPGWAPRIEPQAPIALDDARRFCSAVIDKADFANCVRDVATTGEPGFANVYVAGEKIQRNALPIPGTLVSPRSMDRVAPEIVDFAWMPAKDPDGGKLAYKHCLWPVGAQMDYGRHCRDVPALTYNTSAFGLGKASTYYWKVVVDDGQGGTASSEVRRLSTR